MCKKLNEIESINCQKPQGAFYCFPNISKLGLNSLDLQNLLLEKTGVASVAGTSFGNYGEGFIRFSCANSDSAIEEAMDRVSGFLKNKFS